MQVRAPGPADAEAIGAVHVAAWQVAYRGGLLPDEYLDGLDAQERAALWREALQGPPRARSHRFVAESDGAVVGFLLAGPAGGDPDADTGEVYALNVDPAAWGGGHGGALLEAGTAALAADGFRAAVLWVHPGNDRARRFYEHHGWSVTADERHEEIFGVEVPEVRYVRPLPPVSS